MLSGNFSSRLVAIKGSSKASWSPRVFLSFSLMGSSFSSSITMKGIELRPDLLLSPLKVLEWREFLLVLGFDSLLLFFFSLLSFISASYRWSENPTPFCSRTPSRLSYFYFKMVVLDLALKFVAKVLGALKNEILSTFSLIFFGVGTLAGLALFLIALLMAVLNILKERMYPGLIYDSLCALGCCFLTSNFSSSLLSSSFSIKLSSTGFLC